IALHDAAADVVAEAEPLVGAVAGLDPLRPPAADLGVEGARARQVAGVQLEVHDGGARRATSARHAASSNAVAPNAGAGRIAAGRAAAGRRPGSPSAARTPAADRPAATRIAGVKPSVNATGEA